MSSKESIDVDMTCEGDVRVVAIDGATWRIRVSLCPDTVRLEDADTGELYFEQSPEDLGIRFRGGQYSPRKRFREMILSAFVIGWIKLKDKH
jgi:hypothetical protein